MAAAEAAAVVPEKEPTPTACKGVHRTTFVRRKNTSKIFWRKKETLWKFTNCKHHFSQNNTSPNKNLTIPYKLQ
jgi:hypothetical protein